MPGRNIVKTYIENGYYHLYSRGVDKREIFIAPEDCTMFLHFLKTYLISPKILQTKAAQLLPAQMIFKLLNKNLSTEISLVSFALMPNHFHLQIKQITKDGIEKLMRRVLTSYVQYFNRKYNRIGPLFESIYKAVMTEDESQHLYLSAYVHRNPMKLKNPKFDFIQFSSYPYYLGDKHAEWVKPEEILSYFKSSKNTKEDDLLSYQSFVETFNEEESSLENIILETE